MMLSEKLEALDSGSRLLLRHSLDQVSVEHALAQIIKEYEKQILEIPYQAENLVEQFRLLNIEKEVVVELYNWIFNTQHLEKTNETVSYE